MAGFDEKRLGELDEALRASAVHAGYTFIEEGPLEGILPETPTQRLADLLPESLAELNPELAQIRAKLVAIDSKFVEFPEDLRFLEWASYAIEEGEVRVVAGDVDLGTWTEAEFGELLTRYFRAVG
jgi:hypothetical protein